VCAVVRGRVRAGCRLPCKWVVHTGYLWFSMVLVAVVVGAPVDARADSQVALVSSGAGGGRESTPLANCSILRCSRTMYAVLLFASLVLRVCVPTVPWVSLYCQINTCSTRKPGIYYLFAPFVTTQRLFTLLIRYRLFLFFCTMSLYTQLCSRGHGHDVEATHDTVRENAVPNAVAPPKVSHEARAAL
jgi:hypothetical protein